jgi:hypothetical protein
LFSWFSCAGVPQTSTEINQTTIQTPSAGIFPNGSSTPWIKIDPIGNIHLGEVFTITGTTNLPKNDNISFEIIRTSIHCGKNWCTPIYGITGTVRVNEGNNGINRISFDVNSSAFISDEFTVKLSAENQTAYSTESMYVLPPRNASAAPVVDFYMGYHGNRTFSTADFYEYLKTIRHPGTGLLETVIFQQIRTRCMFSREAVPIWSL